MSDHMGSASDFQILSDAESEMGIAMNEVVTVKRFNGYGTAPASGQAPVAQYLTFNTTAVIDDIGIEKMSNNDGVYNAGDLSCQIRVQLKASVAGQPGDRIVYQGIEYYIVQKPMTIHLSGALHYECILRRTQS